MEKEIIRLWMIIINEKEKTITHFASNLSGSKLQTHSIWYHSETIHMLKKNNKKKKTKKKKKLKGLLKLLATRRKVKVNDLSIISNSSSVIAKRHDYHKN